MHDPALSAGRSSVSGIPARVCAAPAPVSPAAARSERAALAFILAFGIFHLAFSAFVGLAGDEAYYWQWSRHLDWGYYDHPPLVAYLIALGTGLFGQNEFGVRFVGVLLSTAVLWLVYRMTVNYAHQTRKPDDRFSPQSAGLWALAAIAATPLFSIGGFLATPDVPMAFFWTLAVALTFCIVKDSRPRYGVLLGLGIGLGLLGKYPFGILPLGLLLALASTREGRRHLHTTTPYLAAAVAVVVLIPHLLWLGQHAYVSVLFQLGHGLGGGPVSITQRLGMFAQFVAGQAGVLTPILFVLFLGALARGVTGLFRADAGPHTGTGDIRILNGVLVVPAALTALLFTAASFFAKSQTNWPAAAYPTLAILVGINLAHMVRATRARKALAFGAVGLAAVISAYAHLEAAHPLVPYASSVFDKVQDKRGLARWVEALREGAGPVGRAAPLFADNYRTASLLAFYLPDHPQTDAPFESGSGAQYALWRRSGGEATGMAWYFTRFASDPRVAQLFDDYRDAGVYVERRAGVDVGHTHAYYGRLRTGYSLPSP
jgi:dolichol-phosphate mannosyltransferase